MGEALTKPVVAEKGAGDTSLSCDEGTPGTGGSAAVLASEGRQETLNDREGVGCNGEGKESPADLKDVLPDDIWVSIFELLNARDLCMVEATCRNFRDLILKSAEKSAEKTLWSHLWEQLPVHSALSALPESAWGDLAMTNQTPATPDLPWPLSTGTSTAVSSDARGAWTSAKKLYARVYRLQRHLASSARSLDTRKHRAEEFGKLAVLAKNHPHVFVILVEDFLNHCGHGAAKLTQSFYLSQLFEYARGIVSSHRLRDILGPEAGQYDTDALLQCALEIERTMVLPNVQSPVPHVRTTIDEILATSRALDIKSKISEKGGVVSYETVSEVCQWFFGTDGLGFAVNEEVFYSISNSHISTVAHTRKGLPITLAIVLRVLMHRMGVKVSLVGATQGHIMAKFDLMKKQAAQEAVPTEGEGSATSDLEADGHVWVHMWTGEMVREVNDGFSEPMANSYVFHRMLANIAAIAGYDEDPTMRSVEAALSKVHATQLGREAHRFTQHWEDKTARPAMALALRKVSGWIKLGYIEMAIEEIKFLSADEAEYWWAVVGPRSFSRNAFIESLRTKIDSEPEEVKSNDNRKAVFKVGQVFQHKLYAYRGVIIGWDNKCMASVEWIHQMGVHNLPKGPHQPFYNALTHTEDRGIQQTYVAEENVIAVPAEGGDPVEIDHPELGRYFNDFIDGKYIPNQDTLREYPDF